jgi:N,N-dimethylformamidase
MSEAPETPRYLPITGYLDRLSARGGETLDVKISVANGAAYDWDVVRIWSGDPNPAGPGLVFEPVPAFGAGRRQGRFQPIRLGSYARVPDCHALGAPAVTGHLLVQPWLLPETTATLMEYRAPDGGRWRLGLTRHGLSLVLDGGAGEQRLDLGCTLSVRHWYAVTFGWNAATGLVRLACRPTDARADGSWAPLRESTLAVPVFAGGGTLTMAASEQGEDHAAHFDGRLEAPSLHAACPASAAAPLPRGTLIAAWDFARAIDTQSIVDTGPWGMAGTLVNVPTRAVKGSRWSGRAMAWTQAPQDYAAIHFHADDLHDCGWQTDFALAIPQDVPSGVYGVRLSSGDARDIIPFYVLPPRGAPGARLCFLASTFTYQAYGNHARGNCDEAMRQRMRDWDAYPHNPDDFPIYGTSTYNRHPDGSGHAFSSRLRPLMTMRPGFLTFVDARGSGLRHFPADTHLTWWLRSQGLAFDVVTDEDLDAEGPDLIRGYAAVMTGSHPEYHTTRTLDALASYAAQGGNLVYLGGNGFYWKIASTESLPGMLELRRGEGGIRAWDAEPGEYYHALDGEYGGLWRRNGRPPQQLVGVGFSGQGLFEGSHYRLLDSGRDPAVAWILDGIDGDIIGAHGLSGGGAAGFELDRADVALGTPPKTRIIARSEGHAAHFVTVPEELLTHVMTVSGETPRSLIRAEIVHFDTPGGGQVFSVGSITFCGSLPVNGGDNDVSRMLRNVLLRFSGGSGQGEA